MPQNLLSCRPPPKLPFQASQKFLDSSVCILTFFGATNEQSLDIPISPYIFWCWGIAVVSAVRALMQAFGASLPFLTTRLFFPLHVCCTSAGVCTTPCTYLLQLRTTFVPLIFLLQYPALLFHISFSLLSVRLQIVLELGGGGRITTDSVIR